MTKAIVFDIDDTITDLKVPLCIALNKHTGKNIHWDNWNKYSIIDSDIYDISVSEFVDIIKQEEVLENSIPFSGAVRALTRFKERGYKLVYVTARGYIEDAQEITENWMKKWEIPYDEIYISGYNQSKASLVKDIEIKAFVDDKLENCIDFKNSDNCETVFLMDAPWNRLTPEQYRSKKLEVSMYDRRIFHLDCIFESLDK